jgi:hypothetical protein
MKNLSVLGFAGLAGLVRFVPPAFAAAPADTLVRAADITTPLAERKLPGGRIGLEFVNGTRMPLNHQLREEVSERSLPRGVRAGVDHYSRGNSPPIERRIGCDDIRKILGLNLMRVFDATWTGGLAA